MKNKNQVKTNTIKIIAVILLLMALSSCQAETVEVTRIVERVITESSEPIQEVTRIVVVEVTIEVTRIATHSPQINTQNVEQPNQGSSHLFLPLITTIVVAIISAFGAIFAARQQTHIILDIKDNEE